MATLNMEAWTKDMIVIPTKEGGMCFFNTSCVGIEAIEFYLEHLWAEDRKLQDPPEISFPGVTMRLDLEQKMYVFELNGRGEICELPPGPYNSRKKLYVYARSPGEIHNAFMRFMKCKDWPELDIACRNGAFHHLNLFKLGQGQLGIHWQLVDVPTERKDE